MCHNLIIFEGNIIINKKETQAIHSTDEATANENDDDDFVTINVYEGNDIDIIETTVNDVNVQETKTTNGNESYNNNTLESPNITIKVDLKNYDEFKEVEQETVRADETVTNETLFYESPYNTDELDLNFNCEILDIGIKLSVKKLLHVGLKCTDNI